MVPGDGLYIHSGIELPVAIGLHVPGGRDNFGVEAVDTLIKEMEDNRAHLIAAWPANRGVKSLISGFSKWIRMPE